MYLERMGKTVRGMTQLRAGRKEEARDIRYYKQCYEQNKSFPQFTQVLFETRTDCNRRCAF